MVYLHKDYDSAIKKKDIMLSAAIPTDLDIIILSEISQRQISYIITYVQSKEKWHQWTYIQNRNRPTNITNLRLSNGKEVGEGKIRSLRLT